MKLKCLHCEHEFDGTISRDELGWHSSCPVCGASFDVDVPDNYVVQNFNWDGLTEQAFTMLCNTMEAYSSSYEDYITNMHYNDFVGSVRIGNLCFDVLVGEDDNGGACVYYDLYVGGVDTGYGYSNPNKFDPLNYNGQDDYPYDYAGGGTFKEPIRSMSYDVFKKYAESVMENYIYQTEKDYTLCSLVAKANEDLFVW